MSKVKLFADSHFILADIDRRVFSSFIEHMGRAVYGGIYEPGHPLADEHGFRKDVLEAVRELNIPYIRYPGGNFISGYDWRDTIGPKEKRPIRLDLAWKTTETNQFGIDEFIDWCKQANSQMMGAVNLGTGSPKDAGQLLEYCNYPGGTTLSNLRISNGHRAPHNVRLWCVGNEMSGPWQIGHMSAHEYGAKARETAKIMKSIDPTIELIACGSAGSELPSYPEWDRIVLEEAYDQIDYLSLHKYYRDGILSDQDLLCCFLDLDCFFNQVEATCDYVKALKRSNKTIMLSFDEWNIAGTKYCKAAKDWESAPHIAEMIYTLRDAIGFAGMFITILNHADRVRIACQAQLVNVLGPILTEDRGRMVRQTIYYPYQLLSKYACGDVIRSATAAPSMKTRFGDAPQVYSTVIRDNNHHRVCVFCINTSMNEDAIMDIDLQNFGNLLLTEHICLTGNINDKNTFECPDKILPMNLSVNKQPTLPPVSFNLLIYENN